MTKDDFISAVGYHGDTAIVDKANKGRYRGLGASELLEKGYYKAAFCSALYENNQSELELVIRKYNENSEKKYNTVEDLKRLFGVYKIPDEIKKVTLI